jgi:hypothetical protein
MNIIMRLMRELPDGSLEIAGYEKHENHIVRGYRIKHQAIDRHGWTDIIEHPQNYVQHDRKDLYTGADIDGEKVFHRDLLEDEKAGTFIIEWDSSANRIGGFVRMAYPKGRMFLSCDDFSKNKIIGIENVKGGGR